ncbi:MAG: type VI secretion system tube protein TssD [Polyangiaceae bacterium]
MAFTSYMTIEGTKRGNVEGDSDQAPFEKWIRVDAHSSTIAAPRDANSGYSTGRRQHKPFVVTCPVDRATPQMTEMMCQNEVIKEMHLQVLRTNAEGTTEVWYEVWLRDANISNVRKESLNTQYPENERIPFRVTYEITYQEIEEKYVDGGIGYIDRWKDMNVA